MSSKAREALLAVYACAKDGVLTIRESAFEKVLEALKEPVRNCDIGTAGEQDERFVEFCNGNYDHDQCGRHCPFFELSALGLNCALFWAQMPYEEGVTK